MSEQLVFWMFRTFKDNSFLVQNSRTSVPNMTRDPLILMSGSKVAPFLIGPKSTIAMQQAVTNKFNLQRISRHLDIVVITMYATVCLTTVVSSLRDISGPQRDQVVNDSRVWQYLEICVK